MANITWKEIAEKLVVPEAPGCPASRAEFAVLEAAIEFCRKTNVYLAAPFTVSATNNQFKYTLTPSEAQTEISKILRVMRVDGTRYEMLRPTHMFANYDFEPGTPQYFSQLDNNVLVLAPTPTAGENLQVLASLKPTYNSTGMDELIAGEHREAIARGALYRVQSMSGQPWANYAAAAANRQLYNQLIAAVAQRVSGSYVGEHPRVVAPAFV